MHRYAMKAAAGSRPQLNDRMRKFELLGMEPLIELHLAGLDEIFGERRKMAKNCKRHEGCGYIVHYPITDPKRGYVFDMYNDEDENLKRALGLCEEIGSETLIVHRCFGFDRELDKADAENRFFDKAARWNDLGRDSAVKLLYENYGFVWLPAGFDKEFVSSQLDHFFPWEMSDFAEKARRLKLNNTGILLDAAHAVLSSNMFNVRKTEARFRADARFQNITDSDLERKERLLLKDFILDDIAYFHISDSFIWKAADGIRDLKRYIYSEGLPVGKGNIDFADAFAGIRRDKTMIMEIEPEGGDYSDNASQLKAIEYFRRLFNKKERAICA